MTGVGFQEEGCNYGLVKLVAGNREDGVREKCYGEVACRYRRRICRAFIGLGGHRAVFDSKYRYRACTLPELFTRFATGGMLIMDKDITTLVKELRILIELKAFKQATIKSDDYYYGFKKDMVNLENEIEGAVADIRYWTNQQTSWRDNKIEELQAKLAPITKKKELS